MAGLEPATLFYVSVYRELSCFVSEKITPETTIERLQCVVVLE